VIASAIAVPSNLIFFYSTTSVFLIVSLVAVQKQQRTMHVTMLSSHRRPGD